MAADPRDTVTPDAFTVAPEVLGRRTASPVRRLVAFGLDNMLVGLLSALPGAVLGVAGVVVLARLALARQGVSRRARFMLLAGATALALIVGATLARRLLKGEGGPEVDVVAGDTKLKMDVGEALGFVGDLIALQAADTDLERAAAARLLVDHVREAEADPAVARALIHDMASEVDDPLTRQAVMDALEASAVAQPAAEAPDPVQLRALADALEAKSPGVAGLRAEVAARLAADELAQKELEIREAREEAAALKDRVRALEKPKGAMALMRGALDDLGFGFGWFVLYFTAATGWGKGQTLGKRLLRIRVLRLDGKPLTVWNAFNRAGGYAASAATGLLGFAQMFWDANRQALHDKIADTVVVRDAPKA